MIRPLITSPATAHIAAAKERVEKSGDGGVEWCEVSLVDAAGVESVGEVEEDRRELRRRLRASFDLDGDGLGLDHRVDGDGLDGAVDDLNRAQSRGCCSALFPGSMATAAGTPFRDSATGWDGRWFAAPGALDDPARGSGAALARRHATRLGLGVGREARSRVRLLAAELDRLEQ